MINLSQKQEEILTGKICPYCKSKTVFVDSSIVYGKSYGMIYFCQPCRAWVGVHSGTNKAKGRLANAELREYKKEAHLYFDKIWQELKLMKRAQAYKWLSKLLNLPGKYTHIGMFSEKTCKDVIYFSKQFLNDNRRLDLDYGVEPQTPFYNI
ncbi:MAG: zinc-finger-containing protein [Bacteroidia bacterium]